MINNSTKTLILGASPNPARYAHAAAKMLKENNIPFVPVGIKSGEIFGEKILDLKEKPAVSDVHTITMYIGPQNQIQWYDYILSLKPQRMVFNPGSENKELMDMANKLGIEVSPACTLVMLSTGQF